MRQCIFVLGTRAQLVRIAPVLRLAQEAGLRHTLWFTDEHQEAIDDLIADFELSSQFVRPQPRKRGSSIFKLLAWVPRTGYKCHEYVKSVKLWTGKRPLVVVHGDTLSTWLGAVAGRWGGGDIVYLDSGLSSAGKGPFPDKLRRRMTLRKARYALCPNDEAARRMEQYPGCIVANIGDDTLLGCERTERPRIDDDAMPSQMAVDVLVKWAGGRASG